MEGWQRLLVDYHREHSRAGSFAADNVKATLTFPPVVVQVHARWEEHFWFLQLERWNKKQSRLDARLDYKEISLFLQFGKIILSQNNETYLSLSLYTGKNLDSCNWVETRWEFDDGKWYLCYCKREYLFEYSAALKPVLGINRLKSSLIKIIGESIIKIIINRCI